MARLAVLASFSVAALLRVTAPVLASASEPSMPASATLLGCLEPIARTFRVRIVDTTGLAASVPCVPLQQQLTLAQVLDRLLKPRSLNWRRLDDGTIEIFVPHSPPSLKLSALNIEGDPVVEVQRSDGPVATPLVERATASTSLDAKWLDSAPLLGFNQIAWYAPNVYGAGQSLAIRGTERDTDFFPALTVTFDGIDLGTRLLDDELVPLEDVTNLKLARGPRTFESGEDAQAGAISLKTAEPASEPTANVALGVGNLGTLDEEISWSGPVWGTGLAATIALDEHELPNFVRQVAVPEANVEKRHNDFGRIKLRYMADSGLTAELSALALSGDSSDREVVAPNPGPGQPAPAPFDLFDRKSYATDPVVAQTYARGAAGFVRYEEPDRWAIDAQASVTSIARDSTEYPSDVQWTDDELRRRLGVTLSDHPTQDWTILAAIEDDHAATSFYTPISASQIVFGYFATSTDSASIWVEHSWSSTWNTGLGVRWQYEQTTVSTSSDLSYGYHLPIPLAVVEWHPWTDQTFALSYGTGYRSGGQVNSGIITYSPERSENLEVSWRAQWPGGSLHTALSAFDGESHDVFTYELTSAVGNPILASVRDRGIEFELDDDLSDSWRLRAGVGALSSRYSSLAYLNGDPTSEAPPQTATFGVRYGLAQGWYGAVDAYHAAAAQYYNPSGRLPPYDALSFRVGYRSPNWETALIMANALDAKFIERVEVSAANQFGYRLGDPRRIELVLKRDW